MLNLADQTCDTQFDIPGRGWLERESKLIDFLKETPVPLRVYGNWQQLNYSLQVDQLLRKHLRMKQNAVLTTGPSGIRARKWQRCEEVAGEDVGYQVTCPVGLIRRVKRRIGRSWRHHYILNM